ncbi:hypothetical protein BKD30_13000 [Tersicoccus phoenicis]|uniref:Anti-sigma K factor RskA C-terminal domain-containing protein n=1 Tax=Tersicoccus phoenicis TaxID=554083 RepID=A0A1R1L6W0_9MICC|nr:anti-sigma factor [Tersicoccus phoenicis]OMH23267.1 hypothetical protein BKD30_13000 [Tersicoccus phoenicis]
MKHLDGEYIALLALGEQPDDDARAHLNGCAGCRAEFEELRALVGAVRWTGPEPDAPGEGVWDRIRSRMDETPPSPAHTSPSRSGAVAAGRPEQRSDRGPGGRGDADRGPGRRRRRPGARTWSFLAGAVVAALVILAVVWGVGARNGETVVATARLAPLSTQATSGTAELQRAADGSTDLRVRISADQVRGYTEVWLIARDGKRMVSLGTLQGRSGQLPVPTNLNVRDFSTVDISDEPYDGIPTHSGDSILRGSLTF